MLVNPRIIWNHFVRWYNKNFRTIVTNAAVEHIESFSKHQKEIGSDECFLIINSVMRLCNKEELSDWRVARLCAFGLMGITTTVNEISPPDVIGMAMVAYLRFESRWQNWFDFKDEIVTTDNDVVNDTVKKYFYASCVYHGHTVVPRTLSVVAPSEYGDITRNLPKEYLKQVMPKNRNIDRLIVGFAKYQVGDPYVS